MKQNKTSRYFKYALGEVLLVMIGILLAFQVNTWRDHSLEKQKEIKVVKLFIDDLKNENYNLTVFREMLAENHNNLVKLSTFMNTKREDSLISAIPGALQRWNYRPTKPTYDGLVQSNGLGIIKNDSVRNDLIYHFDEVYLYLDDLRNSYKNSNITLQEAFLPYAGRVYSEDKDNWTYTSIENTSNLLKDNSLKHKLGDLGSRSLNLSKRIDGLFLKENKKMQDLLSDYLEKLK